MSGKRGVEQVSSRADSFDSDLSPEGNHSEAEPIQKTGILENRDRKPTTPVEQKVRVLKPLHQRLREYKEAKLRIFGEVSSRVRKARERYKRRKRTRNEISEASLYEGQDARLYTRISINGQEVEGLLDSGATVTCLGRNCEDFIVRAGLRIHPFHNLIRTADGTPHRIIGRVRASVTFGQATQVIMFYLVPSLNRELFLGVDFTNAFKMFVHLHSLTMNNIAFEEERENNPDVITHSLNAE